MKIKLIFLFTFYTSSALFSQQIIPSSSSVNFEISNFGVLTVDGTILNMFGSVDFDSSNLDLCNFDVCIDATTIDTGNQERDEHLNAEDFFDTTNHPNICFSSQNAIKVSDGYAITGTLSIKGIEKLETINFNYSDKTFTGKLTVLRSDFNLGPSGGFTIGKTADIKIVAKVD